MNFYLHDSHLIFQSDGWKPSNCHNGITKSASCQGPFFQDDPLSQYFHGDFRKGVHIIGVNLEFSETAVFKIVNDGVSILEICDFDGIE